MRKLGTIQKILAINPIDGADNIERATILGWNVVVKKGEFSIGDICVFLEIDSVLPDGEEWAEFMRPRKFRVKTCKLRGVLSQGLALPLHALGLSPANFEIGDDVTDTLRIKKYELPPPKQHGFNIGKTKGNFPSFIAKTDEMRLQSVLGVLNEIGDNPLYIATKYDGTSGTFARHEGEFYACSRNLQKKNDEVNVYWEMVKKYDLENQIPEGMAIQGEICGPGIQRNRLMLKEHDLFIFNVYDIKKYRYLNMDDLMSFCAKYNLKNVAMIKGTPNHNLYNLNDWLQEAKGLYDNTKNRREGIVVRTIEPMYSETLGGRLSFKVINNDFLLKNNG